MANTNKARLGKSERETIINFNSAEKKAWIATTIKQDLTSLINHPAATYYRSQSYSECYLIPKQCIKFKPDKNDKHRTLPRHRRRSPETIQSAYVAS